MRTGMAATIPGVAMVAGNGTLRLHAAVNHLPVSVPPNVYGF